MSTFCVKAIHFGNDFNYFGVFGRYADTGAPAMPVMPPRTASNSSAAAAAAAATPQVYKHANFAVPAADPCSGEFIPIPEQQPPPVLPTLSDCLLLLQFCCKFELCKVVILLHQFDICNIVTSFCVIIRFPVRSASGSRRGSASK